MSGALSSDRFINNAVTRGHLTASSIKNKATTIGDLNVAQATLTLAQLGGFFQVPIQSQALTVNIPDATVGSKIIVSRDESETVNIGFRHPLTATATLATTAYTTSVLLFVDNGAGLPEARLLQ